MITPQRSITLMQRALELAAIPGLKVSPNPFVGCVIANPVGEIISEGYHEYYGGPHAEVNAIRQLTDEQLTTASLFVTLEPCNHFGKTPPCTELIISKRIPYVFAAMQDPNPLVAGKGFSRLQEAGVEVQIGLCESEAKALNKRFIHQVTTGQPYIILKWAESQDGFIAPFNTGNFNISGHEAQLLSHQLRATESAILIGFNTALLDNPSLTTRLVDGSNPIRIILDPEGKLPSHLNIFNNEAQTLLITKQPSSIVFNSSVQNLVVPDYTLPNILKELTLNKIQSIIIEGGSKTLQNFIDCNLWNEAYKITNPHLLIGQGVPAPKMPSANPQTTFELGQDTVTHYSNLSPFMF